MQTRSEISGRSARWRHAGLVGLFVLGVTALTSVAATAAPPAPEGSSGFRSLTAVAAERQMVTTANPLASEAGLEILRAGGSAVDAAIAAVLVLNLVEPQSAGIGGGGFLLTYDARNRRVRAYDGRETAPLGVDPRQFVGQDGAPAGFMDAVIGGQSVGTPGLLRMLELAHARSGKLAWKRLFSPAIRLAREGFLLSPRLHALLTAAAPALVTMEPAASYFLQGGAAKPVGTTMINAPLAEVFERIADGGADVFYTGALAEDVAAAARTASRRGGTLQASDLAAYRAIERAPVCGSYRKSRVCSMGPPSSGGIATLQILAMMSDFDAAAASEEALAHRFVEAGKRAYADRDRYVADADFVKLPRLLDARYLRARAATITDRATATVSAGSPPGAPKRATAAGTERPSTTHVCVVDTAGNAVSLTATIENAFGSMVMTHGFLLNNQMTDFAFVPEVDGIPVANRIEPGKRPRSSMAPVIVTDRAGHFRVAIGAAGGARIINFVTWALIGILDRGLDPQRALSLPHVSGRGGPVELEAVVGHQDWAKTLTASLEARGHTVIVGEMNSGLQAITKSRAGLLGGVDPRREGAVAGD
jgi:gamma-glutamyltranspeptidase/glutathione hydrolase